MNIITTNDMAKKLNKISEKDISLEFNLLNQTHGFLLRQRTALESKLTYFIKKLENDYTEDTEKTCNEIYTELQNLIKKIQWEMKQCQNFDSKVEIFNKTKHLNMVTSLARKILNKDKN